MPKVSFKGPGASYTYGNFRFIGGQESQTQDVPEKVADALIATGRFESVRGATATVTPKTARRKPGITINAAAGSLPDLKEGEKPEFPASGFKEKRELEAYARKYLGYEADLRKALKTLTAEAHAKYAKLFLEAENAAAEEHPEDLFDDDELNTVVEGAPVVDTLADLEDDDTADEKPTET